MIDLIGTGSAFYTLMVNGVPHTTIVDGVSKVSTFTQWWTASGAAFKYKVLHPADVVAIRVQQEIRVEGTVSLPVPVPVPIPVPVPAPIPVNRAPQWLPVPAIMFTLGVAQRISIAAYANDPDGDALAIIQAAGTLPAGVTYDVAAKAFVYDGIGAAASTSGNILNANDGKP